MAGTAYCFMGEPQKPIGKSASVSSLMHSLELLTAAASMRLSMGRYKKDNLTRVLWDQLQSQVTLLLQLFDSWVKVG